MITKMIDISDALFTFHDIDAWEFDLDWNDESEARGYCVSSTKDIVSIALGLAKTMQIQVYYNEKYEKKKNESRIFSGDILTKSKVVSMGNIIDDGIDVQVRSERLFVEIYRQVQEVENTEYIVVTISDVL